MKPSKPIYIFVIVGLIIAMMVGMGIAILTFSEYLNIDNLPYRILLSATGIYIFSMFFCGLQMTLNYKEETFLSNNKRRKQWKHLNPRFMRIWAISMNIGTGFFAIGAVFAIISMIVFKDLTHGTYLLVFIGLLIWDIKTRKKHPEEYKIIRIFNTERDFINELENPPLWRRVYRFIIWTPVGLIYHLWTFLFKTKKPKKFTKEIIFHIIHKKSRKGKK